MEPRLTPNPVKPETNEPADRRGDIKGALKGTASAAGYLETLPYKPFFAEETVNGIKIICRHVRSNGEKGENKNYCYVLELQDVTTYRGKTFKMSPIRTGHGHEFLEEQDVQRRAQAEASEAENFFLYVCNRARTYNLEPGDVSTLSTQTLHGMPALDSVPPPGLTELSLKLGNRPPTQKKPAKPIAFAGELRKLRMVNSAERPDSNFHLTDIKIVTERGVQIICRAKIGNEDDRGCGYVVVIRAVDELGRYQGRGYVLAAMRRGHEDQAEEESKAEAERFFDLVCLQATSECVKNNARRAYNLAEAIARRY